MQYTQIGPDQYFKITDSAALRPFFMSIVSDSDHWMFIASNGGLSAGRKNADHALFPYYTDDKITESAEITGSKTLFHLDRPGVFPHWEPFSSRYEGLHRITRNLYKHVFGNKIIFEEINHDLELTWQVEWNSSDAFGFVRKCRLINHGPTPAELTLLDGLQNILPAGVPSSLQNTASNLVDAYKRSELDPATGLGIYALSAIIVDKAEPSEALKANVVWSFGLECPAHLLSSRQLGAFRRGLPIQSEEDVKAEKGAYLLYAQTTLLPQAEKAWTMVANLNQSHAAVVQLQEWIKNDSNLPQRLEQDIAAGTKRLLRLVAAADGMQLSSDQRRDTRHYSNVLFNIMRGGIFDDNYQIEKWDFSQYLAKANTVVFAQAQAVLAALPAVFSLFELKKIAQESTDPHLMRLCLEYLPLKFSRRHGDPSRPWNVFSINTRSEKDGSKILDYQGNWRDIFQNWEALAHAYPAFIDGMVYKFLNASTFDGYNPYRITKDGFDWETIEPDNPWSYIGYWGDHQVIYLLKFLEFMEDHVPGQLGSWFDQSCFVYANVPYRIKGYADILKNPKDTIEFDHHLDQKIQLQKAQWGADGALLQDKNGNIYTVTLLEKILATVLAKMANFVPEGGIWMNTQRPEWNDANNALVGNGISVVTLAYLRRFLAFFKKICPSFTAQEIHISAELMVCLERVVQTLDTYQPLLSGKINDQNRKRILDGLGQAGSAYRRQIYAESFVGTKKVLTRAAFESFLDLSLRYLDHTLAANQRPDHLYHAYNLLTIIGDDAIAVTHLSEMLEGQVAALSSQNLSAEEAVLLLDSLSQSELYRSDQSSYLLYPNKDLPGFLAKNNLSADHIQRSALLTELVAAGNRDVIEKDVAGGYHFNGNFRNAADLKEALAGLHQTPFAALVETDQDQVLQIFEDLFNHQAFTGRSGTFFGYEGLGSIYWHMVSKLQLAVLECCQRALDEKVNPALMAKLLAHYYAINAGIGVHKSPEHYGAFPTDPYSHTPAGKGAQQPGMTGQVKEDILSRFGELGVRVKNGQLHFYPRLLRKAELLAGAKSFEYVNVQQENRQLQLAEGALAFTYCQVPVVYQLASKPSITLTLQDGATVTLPGLTLDATHSQEIFARTGRIIRVDVMIEATILH